MTIAPDSPTISVIANLYGSVNNEAKNITDLYGSASEMGERVTKLYGPSEFPESFSVEPDGTVVTSIDGVKLCATAKSQYPSTYKQTVSFTFSYSSDGTYYASGEDRNGVSTFYRSGGATALANAGIIFSPSVTSGASVTLVATYNEAITGTKIVYQGFGHIDHGYGVVTYYTDSGHTTTDSVFIASQTEFNRLRSLTSNSWNATIGGHTIPNTDILGLIITNKVDTIPAGFLRGCTAFNSDLALPSTITTIGSSSGANFMRGCTNMVSTVNFGSLPTSIVSTTDSNSFTTGTSGTAPAYTSGIKIAGSNRSAWLSFYPNSSHTPYRKLVDAGY